MYVFGKQLSKVMLTAWAECGSRTTRTRRRSVAKRDPEESRRKRGEEVGGEVDDIAGGLRSIGSRRGVGVSGRIECGLFIVASGMDAVGMVDVPWCWGSQGSGPEGQSKGEGTRGGRIWVRMIGRRSRATDPALTDGE